MVVPLSAQRKGAPRPGEGGPWSPEFELHPYNPVGEEGGPHARARNRALDTSYSRGRRGDGFLVVSSLHGHAVPCLSVRGSPGQFVHEPLVSRVEGVVHGSERHTVFPPHRGMYRDRDECAVHQMATDSAEKDLTRTGDASTEDEALRVEQKEQCGKPAGEDGRHLVHHVECDRVAMGCRVEQRGEIAVVLGGPRGRRCTCLSVGRIGKAAYCRGPRRLFERTQVSRGEGPGVVVAGQIDVAQLAGRAGGSAIELAGDDDARTDPLASLDQYEVVDDRARYAGLGEHRECDVVLQQDRAVQPLTQAARQRRPGAAGNTGRESDVPLRLVDDARGTGADSPEINLAEAGVAQGIRERLLHQCGEPRARTPRRHDGATSRNHLPRKVGEYEQDLVRADVDARDVPGVRAETHPPGGPSGLAASPRFGRRRRQKPMPAQLSESAGHRRMRQAGHRHQVGHAQGCRGRLAKGRQYRDVGHPA